MCQYFPILWVKKKTSINSIPIPSSRVAPHEGAAGGLGTGAT